MDATEQRAVLTVCLMAAFADGGNDEPERAEIKRIADASPRPTLDVAGDLPGRAARKPELAAVAAAIAPPAQPAVRVRDGRVRLRRRRRARRRRSAISWRGSRRRSASSRRGAAFAQQADAVTSAARADRARRRRRRRRAGECGRARPDDPQLRDPQRRAGAAAAIARVDGDHPAADEDGLPDRQGARLRARSRAHQGPARDARRRPDRRSTSSRSAAS